MFFAAERNAINVEIQAFRNLTYNAARYETRRGFSRLNQKINSILLSSHWRSKSCSTTPPSNICHSPAAGFFRPIPSFLVNSSSLVPKTRPNRSVRKSVIWTRLVLSAARETRSPLGLVNSQNVAETGFRCWFPTLKPSDLRHIRDAPTGSARNWLVCKFRRLMECVKLSASQNFSFRLRKSMSTKRK